MIAEALLRIKRSVTIQIRWISGLMVGLFRAFVAINGVRRLTVANP